jgi:hypothetical protein
MMARMVAAIVFGMLIGAGFISLFFGMMMSLTGCW